ncbi:type I-E CRISPR-associated protein Cse2/CasB [Arthrobacter sp. HLT1-20]
MEKETNSTLEEFIHKKVDVLQKSYVFGDRRGSAATLAMLRRAVGKEPGVDPDIWDVTVVGLPPWYVGKTDAPSEGEHAAHTAMTLYAVHQQSKTTPMHREGPSLGRAVAKLAKSRSATESPEVSKAVKRRFDALLTAVTFDELVTHARGLIQQLRAADISLDYGRFAEDLRKLQLADQADSVRRHWGRDYSYELFKPSKTESSKTSTSAENK